MPIYECELPKMTIEIFRGQFFHKWEALKRADWDDPVSREDWPHERHLSIASSEVDRHDDLPAHFSYTLKTHGMLLGTILMWQQYTDVLFVEVQAMPWAADLWFDHVVSWLKDLEPPSRENPYEWALARKEEGMTNRAIYDGWVERYISMYGEEKFYTLKGDPYDNMTRHLRRKKRRGG